MGDPLRRNDTLANVVNVSLRRKGFPASGASAEHSPCQNPPHGVRGSVRGRQRSVRGDDVQAGRRERTAAAGRVPRVVADPSTRTPSRQSSCTQSRPAPASAGQTSTTRVLSVGRTTLAQHATRETRPREPRTRQTCSPTYCVGESAPRDSESRQPAGHLLARPTRKNVRISPLPGTRILPRSRNS